MRCAAFAAIALVWAQSAQAAACREENYESVEYVICDVDLTQDMLRLFLYDQSGTRPYGYFTTLNTALEEQGFALGFAMNAGMYHEDRAPVGLYIEDGKMSQDVITSAGPGNFGLLPNGVLCLRDRRADVIETLRYVEQQPDCNSATQSGPMLVIDGELHPRFLRDSTSRYIRNGVGTSDDGRVASFVISNNPVTFHTFASFFRDHLGLNNALYFDGNVSRLRAPDLGRDDIGFGALGPIVGVVEGQIPPPEPVDETVPTPKAAPVSDDDE
ncbi:phosphodiester glycosidase family protein [Sulfitobacter sp. F26169L]|uniref:phosphodiester glycosidase family protein n=1 Tax=Sulfitobacter sp. F26169L TaxID=2996015 RepID=UPI002260C237|nr:phosphodiester glycosidase family protein [Sulfitobacter sp. F26169L]MCX7565622.1 phosphodiester glycosidase family protein [Sulfitobacter sp. F26169L]